MTGNKLTPQILLNAYSQGVFPMAESRNSNTINWFDPEWRGVFFLDSIHIPKKLAKKIKQNPFKIYFNKNFNGVIQGCSSYKIDRKSTWINDEITEVYSSLFDLGFVYTVEAWDNNNLVGGLYGVTLGGVFFGESMFSLVSDSSKISLIYLLYMLKKFGYLIVDTQYYTKHLGTFGAKEIHRTRYKKLLNQAIKIKPMIQPLPNCLDGSEILQSITQTS
tara:strand:+ start:54 stop:710 length:657 start_codon:yes stop_codon:yes gene_type:complete